MASEDVILRRLAEKSNVRVVFGNFRGLDGTRAVVDFSGGRVPAIMATPYRPELNEPVTIFLVEGKPYLVGPTVPKPPDGVVVSTAAGFAVVSTDIGDVNATFEYGATLTAGQLVKLMWGNGCHIVSVMSAAPTLPDVPPAPGSGDAAVITRTFTAKSSGSYRAGTGWRTNDVWSTGTDQGLWFYGSKIADTIPDTADIVAAQIYLPVPTKDTGSRPFGRHAYSAQPSGAPTLTSLSTLTGTSGWVDIPTGLVDWLKSNTGGVGFGLGGTNIWPGTQADGQSGALKVSYQI